MDLLLITPPFTQLNTPYPAVPVLTRHLRDCGYTVVQRDFSLDLSLRLFTPENLRRAAARIFPELKEGPLAFFRDSCEDYCRTLPQVLAFLQGRRPELAWRIAVRNYLPEGPHFRQLDTAVPEDEESDLLRDSFGVMGTADQAKYLASLYFDDVAEYLRDTLDSGYAFGKYEEKLAVSLPVLDPLLQRLQETTPLDEMLEQLTGEALAESRPRWVGLAVPFPGTLYGALRIAATVRKLSPGTRIVLGGGYVNSELREVEEPRLFHLVDAVCYDEGLAPMQAILAGSLHPAEQGAVPGGCHAVRTKDGLQRISSASPLPSLLIPAYDGLDLNQYFPLVEMTNPMHRIWTDGCWLKLQLTRGCYWHKCAFCDLALEYIGKYQPATAVEIVDAMERLMGETGRCGFHFTDEAVAPALLDAVSREILRRGLSPVWWGNVRFDRGFTPALARRMAEAGCIAVTGGLECATDRLLALMNKGITLASAQKAFQAFAEAGIYVHAYLMYGFPTETRQDAADALEFVRGCFAAGLIQSAFWHRFALTAHSGIAAHPDAFGIRLAEVPLAPGEKRFARNEIPYEEDNAPDWQQIGKGLSLAVYNYMLGRGLEIPAADWLAAPSRRGRRQTAAGFRRGSAGQ